MKKFIAKLLAFLMIVNMIPAMDLKPVMAADPIAIDASFKESLVTDPTSDTPRLNTASHLVLKDTATLRLKPVLTGYGTVITYAMDENTVIKLTLKNTPSPAVSFYDAYFEVYKYEEAAGNPGVLQWQKQKFAPRIYSYTAGQADAFVPAPVFIGKLTESSLNKVIEEKNGDEGTGNYYFSAKINEGFTFLYDERYTISFLYSSSDETFRLTTDRVLQGRIFEFFCGSGAPGSTWSSVKVFAGIDENTVDFIPLANEENGGQKGGYADISNPGLDPRVPLRNDDYELTYSDEDSGAADLILPAYTDVALAVRFNEPFTYDYHPDTTDFDLATTALARNPLNANDYTLSFVLEMDHNLEADNKFMQFKVPNMLSLTPKTFHRVSDANVIKINDPTVGGTVHTTNPFANITADTVAVRFLTGTPSSSPRRGEILIEGLRPGMLFSGVNINSELRALNTTFTEIIRNKEDGINVAFGRVFTFLDYRFSYDGLEFKVEFTPYRGYSGTYTVRGGREVIGLSSNGTSFESVTMSVIAPNVYQVTFMPDSLASVSNPNAEPPIYSEKSFYSALDVPLSLGPARNFKVESYSLTADRIYDSSGVFGAKGLLDLSFSWQLGYVDSISKAIDDNVTTEYPDGSFHVTYSMLKGFSDDKDAAVSFGILDIVITNTANGFVADYRVLDETTGDQLYPEEGATLPRSELVIEEGRLRMAVEIEDIPAERATNSSLNEAGYKFLYEKIYFVALETYPLPSNKIRKISLFDSITLSDIADAPVPPVRNLAEIATEQTSMGFTWDVFGTQMADYYKRYAYLPISDDFSYNIYISQSEEAIKAAAVTLEGKEIPYVDSGAGQETGAMFNFAIKPGELTDLRGEQVLKITGVATEDENVDFASAVGFQTSFQRSMDIQGLDKNQTYYIYVTLTVKHNGVDDSGDAVTHIKESGVSIMLGLTTKGDIVPPDGEDKRPPAPKVEIKDVGIDTATPWWYYADLPLGNEKVYYEIIRTAGQQIEDKYVDSYDSLEELYSIFTTEMPFVDIVYLQTPVDGTGTAPLIYNGTSFVAAADNEYSLLHGTEILEFFDKSLSSNKIYFYYVRTVRISEKGKVVYSVWNYTTCTTTTVKPPINLRSVYDLIQYDPKTEIVFSFDAPLNNISALDNYDVEYSIKIDDEDFSAAKPLDANVLKVNYEESALKGYIYFYYTLSGLTQGTMYSIRVRLVNKESKDTSVWSNVLRHRTEMDEEEYIRDKEVESWMRYYKDQLMLLVNKSYWTTQNNTNRFTAVYRPTSFPSLLAGRTGSLEMPTGQVENGIVTMYIPAVSFEQANAAQAGFVMDRGDLQLITSPGLVNLEVNEAVKKIADRTAKKEITDYYVAISVEFRVYTALVNSQTPLSQNLILKLTLEGSNVNNSVWDTSRLKDYMGKIAAEEVSASVMSRLATMIETNKTDEEIISYINTLVQNFDRQMIASNHSALTKTLKYSEKINQLDAMAIIVMKNADPSVQVAGYRLDSIPTALETIVFGSGKAIYTILTGSFVFAGLKIELPGMPSQPGMATTYAIIAKYGLTDFLGIGGVVNINENASRQSVMGVASRMMGAQKGADSALYLKNRGLNVSASAADNIVTKQEAVYLVMAVYEAKTNTKVSTIKINNYTILSGVTGLNSLYKQSIYAAYQLGIVKVSPFAPKDPVSIKELLDMLTDLDARSNL